MLGRVGLPRFGNEQTYSLIRSSPLGIQLAVVAEGYLRRREGGRMAVRFMLSGLALLIGRKGHLPESTGRRW